MLALLTAEEIAKATDDLTGIANIRAINRLYRDQDDPHLWPIWSRFNATEQAIRRAQRFRREYSCVMEGLEYCLLLDHIISEIVNNST